MVQVIFGNKGEGKTKKIISKANSEVKDLKGTAIFIDDDSRYIFDIKHEIRFIDASEYMIDGPKMFFGFICGLIAQDYDLERIYIDGFLKIVHHKIEELEGFFTSLEALSEKFGITITISVSGDPASKPAYLERYTA